MTMLSSQSRFDKVLLLAIFKLVFKYLGATEVIYS